MDKKLITDAARQLDILIGSGSRDRWARPQAVRQFNSLLEQAKAQFSHRVDILSLEEYGHVQTVDGDEFTDAVRRLRVALELRASGSIGEIVDSIELPSDAPVDLVTDLQEFKNAVNLELYKTTLLLAGAIAEALLLSRHPNSSDRGPGLAQLVKEARDTRLFGRDTLRQLDTLVDYRDLIHTRAGMRTKISPTNARAEQAVMALKLLCSELQDETVKY